MRRHVAKACPRAGFGTVSTKCKFQTSCAVWSRKTAQEWQSGRVKLGGSSCSGTCWRPC